MPGCVLRVHGSTSNVRAFLAKSRLGPSKVYFRGDPNILKRRGPLKYSGFNVPLTSERLGSSSCKQSLGAAAFLSRHRAELKRLSKFGLTKAVLDFGLWDRATEKYPWPTYPLSRKLVALAGEFGFAIELSFYGPAD